MALYPLHQAFGVERVFASTYQAVSGTGAQAIVELENQVRQLSQGEDVSPEVYPHQIAFNVLPHVDSFLAEGYTREEMKLENEGRKIMHHPSFRASVTVFEARLPRSFNRYRAEFPAGGSATCSGHSFPAPIDVVDIRSKSISSAVACLR